MSRIPFLLIKPLKPISFRWGGEFSPILSGPANKGVSEPLPLPSTIAGFLYSVIKNGGDRKDVDKLSLKEDLNTINIKLWGPLLYANGKYYSHSYPGKLIKLDSQWKRVEEVDVYKMKDKVLYIINKIGIGIDFDSKNAKESLLYSQELIKINGGIVIESDQKIEGYYTMGGESSIVKVEVFNDIKVPQKGDYGLVLSPIIFNPIEKIISIEDLYNAEIEGVGKLKDITVSKLTGESNLIKIGLIALGYNMAYNVRRPIYPAIMPGSVIKYEKRGNIGLFAERGWGSVLPISG